MAFSFDERGNPTTYEYDPNCGCSGRRGTVTNDDGVVLDYQEWLYDERDRLTDHLTPRGDLIYSYDASGNLKSVNSGNVNGVELAYDYDVLNRLKTVYDAGAAQPPLEHDYGYDDVGNLQSLSYANGVTHTWTYNSLNRLTNLVQSSGSGTLYGYTYELRDSGHRSRQTETSGRVVDYTYDNLYRLTSETITSDPYAINGTSTWTYDLVGNRLSQTSSLPLLSSVQNHTFNENDWLDGTIYDDNGNTTLEDGNADVYDFMNRLVRRTTSGGEVIGITYDADGNRITKSAPAGVTHYLVDMNNLTGYAQVLEELDSTLTTERVYTYGLDLIAQHQLMPVDAPTGWETSYYLYDGLGTVRALADASGSISDAYTFDAWGNLINAQGLTPNSYLFTGEQWDHDLAMYFLRARYMNSESGGFHTMDTFEGRNTDPQTLHKYLYTHANPVSFTDPTGMFTLVEIMISSSVAQKLRLDMSDLQFESAGPTIDALKSLKAMQRAMKADFDQGQKRNSGQGDLGRKTIAIAEVNVGKGRNEMWIAVSSPDGNRKPPSRILEALKKSGYEVKVIVEPTGTGSRDNRMNHAERLIERRANRVNATPLNMVVSRPMCSQCDGIMHTAKFTPSRRLRLRLRMR